MNPAAFSFPLNVYAALLQWTEGRAEYLHYGLFERADEPIGAAQERTSARLWAQMPPPCRVLEVGIGLGTTLARLVARGYDAHGITPDAAQARAAADSTGLGARIEVTRLEDLARPAQPWSLMLLQESAQYIDPLALFEAAHRLLDDARATLLVMDEFALRRDSDADAGLHLIDPFKALAGRFGWRVEHEEDVSASARLTLDMLLDLTARHRERLCAELGVSEGELDALDASNRRYRALYERGVYGYRLLRLERGAAPRAHPVQAFPDHADAMRRLFATTFGRDMGPAEWNWKYGEGRGQGVGLVDAGELVAFYGGVARALSAFGRDAVGCQICDVMVAPQARPHLSRGGALHKVTATFLETQLGWGRAHLHGFGFPTDRALGVAERLGLYARVDEMVQLAWDAAPLPRGGWRGGWQIPWRRWTHRLEAIDVATIEPGDATWRELERLWDTMRTAFAESVLCVRNAAWLRHRYGRKPGVPYPVQLLRRGPTGPVLGALACRVHDDHLELLDLIGDPARFSELIDAARAIAHEQHLPEVRLWITASHRARLGRALDAARLTSLNLHIPANAHSPAPAPATLKDRWFLTGGDTDFR